jgi:hypothetical protein
LSAVPTFGRSFRWFSVPVRFDAEASSTFRVGYPPRPKPWRLAGLVAQQGRGLAGWPVWVPVRAEALAVHRFRGSVRLESLWFRGLLYEASHPCRGQGEARSTPHGGGFVSRPRLPLSFILQRGLRSTWAAASGDFRSGELRRLGHTR